MSVQEQIRKRIAILLLTVLTLSLVFALPLGANTAAQTPAQVVFADPRVEFIIGPQLKSGASWFDQTQLSRAKVHGAACPAVPPSDPDLLNSFELLDYYDLPLTEYAAFYRSGDPQLLAYARKCADAKWQHPNWIKSGAQRDFDNGKGPPPRHAGIGGLILRALDGRPEMWDWIVAYTRHQFDNWLKRRISDPQLYYGVREGAFMVHYAVWVGVTLPDSYPNAAQIRSQLLADVEAVSVNYFARLQHADGSWRWNTSSDEFVDSDGGTLQGVMQPFMVGLLLNALVDVHRSPVSVSAKTNVANQIVKGVRHLYFGGPYRSSLVPGLNGVKWRDFWYLYHGGTSVNPTRYQNGGQSYTDVSSNSDCGTSASCTIGIGRQAISTIVVPVAYAYLLTGDPALKAAAEDLFDAAFNGTDGFRGMADGSAKNYNQNYRTGGRFLVWMPTSTGSPAATPSPSPTPTESANGAEGVQVIDSSLAVWAFGAQKQTLRNGTHVGGGFGSLYLYSGKTVYTLGTDSSWYKWTGSAWQFVGAKPIVVLPSPSPTPQPSPTPLPSPVPSPAPTVETREVLDQKWPSNETERSSLWQKLMNERWNDCLIYNNKIRCWRVKGLINQ